MPRYYSPFAAMYNRFNLKRARQTAAKYLTICFSFFIWRSCSICQSTNDFIITWKQKKTFIAQFDANKSKSIIHHYVFLAAFFIHLRSNLNITSSISEYQTASVKMMTSFVYFLFLRAPQHFFFSSSVNQKSFWYKSKASKNNKY